ncbi:MAG: ATPase, T2SS/T4P/T4SS family [Actinomycetota bacterium]|nr:ATPase, T2SS/T4P/T4SS family [Actinomycetota bacterium]
MDRERLGQILLRKNLINEEQLKNALKTQERSGERLGNILIDKNYITPEELVDVLSYQKGFDTVDLAKVQDIIEPGVVNLIPRDFASKRKVFSFKLSNNNLSVAMFDPLDINLIDEIRLITGYNIQPFIATRDSIDSAIKLFMTDDYSLQEIKEIIDDRDFIITEKFEDEVVEGNPLVRLANRIILKAVSMGASDIHIEPQEKNCAIRFRIDGVMQKIKEVPKTVQRLLISRYKIMGGMDITENRLSQDGRSSFNYHGNTIDLRFASIPTVFGENITIRLLNVSENLFYIKNLGMDPEDEAKFKKMIHQPHGSIIITGPTGSGKTTTLYASLNQISSPDKKIFTIEDPVEYRLGSIMQVQVNSRVGMDFSRGLRAMLRSDPDIIMVGEIRDLETAKIVMQASVTGHLVLTTLHTNDAPSTLARLLQMGVESYMISSATSGIVAQRLVRLLCPECKQETDLGDYTIDQDIMDILKGHKIYKPVGCSKCNNLGYKGRTGIFSVLVVSRKIREMLLEKRSADDIAEVAKTEGMKTLTLRAAEKVAEGVTSLEEMYRVVY